MYPKEYIKMKDLKSGYLYLIKARNANYGIWIPERQSFAISRIKFGSNYIFEEHHWDCKSFATAAPLEEIEESPFKAEDIKIIYPEKDGKKYFCYQNEEALLGYLNKFEGERSHGASLEWIKKEGAKYEGRWVAVKSGYLLGDSDKYKELYDKFGHFYNVTITRVLKEKK